MIPPPAAYICMDIAPVLSHHNVMTFTRVCWACLVTQAVISCK